MADINYTGHLYSQGMGGHDLSEHDLDGRGADGQGVDGRGAHAAPEEPEMGGASFGGAVRVLGAMASLALVAGIGIWGYKLVVRDVSGLPVVRALEGPMRVQPDNPGGQQADHQGLAVNTVAAAGSAAPTADRLMLAPRPVELAEEDAPASQVKPQLVSLDLGPVQQAGPAAASASAPPTPETAAAKTAANEDVDIASVNALVEQLTAGVAPISTEQSPILLSAPSATPEVLPDAPTSDTTDAGTAGQGAEPEVHLAVLTGPGLTQSLRPVSRPARAVASGAAASDPGLASAINAAVSTLASVEVNPDSLPTGTRMAQLGAYDSPEIARAEWDKLAVRFEDYMHGKQRVVQKATSGGRTFYRLRVTGFEDLNAARRFCSALVSESTDCIPVTTR